MTDEKPNLPPWVLIFLLAILGLVAAVGVVAEFVDEFK